MNKGKTMTDWAEREVEIVLNNLKKSIKESDDFKYSKSVYVDALNVYKCIMKQSYSGYSFYAIRYILDKLMNEIPLSPINGEDDEWVPVPMQKDGVKVFQSIRRYSLFKEVSENGTINYTDTDRVVCIDIDTSEKLLFGDAVNLIDKMFPITIPYEPKKEKFKVFVKKSKSSDICLYKYVITPDGKKSQLPTA